MKILFQCAGIFMLALCGVGCHRAEDHSGHDHDHNPAHNHAMEEEGEHGAEGEGGEEIILEPSMAKKMGVVVTTIEPTEFREVITTSGEILATPTDNALAVAPVAGIVTIGNSIAPGANVGAGSVIATIKPGRVAGGNPNAAAKAAVDAAKRELDRATPLVAEGIVSEKEYAALKAAYDSALAAYSSQASSGSATSPIGGVITSLLVNQGEYVEAGQPVAQISRTQRLNLRADVAMRHASRLATIDGANFRPSGSDVVYQLDRLGGKRVGGATVSQSQGGYTPVYFSFDNPGGDAVPGSYVQVMLLGQRRSNVITIPVTALTEQMGEKYVYVQLDEHGYERRLVKTGATDGVRVEILEGISSGDQVVTQGATVVKLAENSGKVPEGHSHNH